VVQTDFGCSQSGVKKTRTAYRGEKECGTKNRGGRHPSLGGRALDRSDKELRKTGPADVPHEKQGAEERIRGCKRPLEL